MNTVSCATNLQKARKYFLEHGDCPSGVINERVARSWQRSLAAGLTPAGQLTELEHFTGNRLRGVLSRNHELLAHARPVMEYLYDQLRDSHSMIILTDQRATLMQTLGDVDFLTKAERVALSVGASWQERVRGTNAIGTALAETDSIEINGAEHYLERNGFLTCAAAPIMAGDATLMGVIDVSGDHRNRHPHTLGLVSMAARMIENRLILTDHRHSLCLRLHAYPQGIGSVAEGIVTLSEDGMIRGANRAGFAMLGLSPIELGAVSLRRVFSTSFEDLLAWHRRHPEQTTQVQLRDGNRLFARLHIARPMTLSQAVSPVREPATDALAELDSGDAAWRGAMDKARRILDKPIPLLIQGESGVGKEYFARAVHESGPRKQGPFVAINCAALPENLVEAELFGYCAGAFTGARREGYQGRLCEAQGGTLFLDEIGDMPLAMQTRLLRVLQERSVTPLGGGKPVEVDFSLICATHRKLSVEVDKGNFRHDLYYRINGLTLSLPALRERSDLPVLTERILQEINPGRSVFLSPSLLSLFGRYSWPGNLRQYANALRTASAMLDEYENCIDRQHLADDLIEELTEIPRIPEDSKGLPRNLKELSLTTIRNTLKECGGNVSRTARILGISRQTLYRKLRALENKN
ncbi:MAG: sigma-54-dependent Fis family transcriptional regulator [Candidatus Thiodiazotropha sp.]